jgi:hypothetical protein
MITKIYFYLFIHSFLICSYSATAQPLSKEKIFRSNRLLVKNPNENLMGLTGQIVTLDSLRGYKITIQVNKNEESLNIEDAFRYVIYYQKDRKIDPRADSCRNSLCWDAIYITHSLPLKESYVIRNQKYIMIALFRSGARFMSRGGDAESSSPTAIEELLINGKKAIKMIYRINTLETIVLLSEE